MPAHSQARAEGLGDSWHGGQRAHGQLESSRQIRGAVFIRERKSLFFGKAKLPRLFVIGNVSTCCLGSQPLTQIALIGVRPVGQLCRRHGVRRKRLVEAQLFSDHHHSGVNRRTEISDKLTNKSIQLVHIDSGYLCSAHS